jgi:hypothetical protein
MAMVRESAASWCHSRVPQSGQKAHSTFPPLSASRAQYRGVPLNSLKLSRGTMNEMPNADADCLRHSVQWQM